MGTGKYLLRMGIQQYCDCLGWAISSTVRESSGPAADEAAKWDIDMCEVGSYTRDDKGLPYLVLPCLIT